MEILQLFSGDDAELNSPVQTSAQYFHADHQVLGILYGGNV